MEHSEIVNALLHLANEVTELCAQQGRILDSLARLVGPEELDRRHAMLTERCDALERRLAEIETVVRQ